MKILKIEIETSYGKRYIFIRMNQIKLVEYDFGPGYIKIYYLDKYVDGYVENGFQVDRICHWMSNFNDFDLKMYENLQDKCKNESSLPDSENGLPLFG